MGDSMTFLINGREYRAEPDPDATLLSVLRDYLGLTGTRYGCGEAQCGACTVLIDGVPKRSCVTDAEAAVGKKITTVEGLEQNGKLHPVQESFLEADAYQCGYCTSGMIMATVGLLQQTPNPTDQQIIDALDRNLCRCGTYPRILSAVRRAAEKMKEGRNG